MKEQFSDRAEQVLHSLQGIQKAVAPDFFYTRLMGKMQNSLTPEKKPIFLLRPVFIMAMLFVVFILNIVSLTRINRHTPDKAVVTNENSGTLESFAKAYNLETETTYE